MNKEQAEKQKKAGRITLIGGQVFGISPAVIGIVGSSLFPGCNESNCALGALPWATFLTFPIGIVVSFVGLVIMLTARPTTK